MSTPAGWYPDSTDETLLRYRDGSAWTEHTEAARPGVPVQQPGAEEAAPDAAEEEIDTKGLRPDIAAAVKGWKYGGKREIKKLVEHLQEGETVDVIATGFYGGGKGIVVLTDRRLMFVKEGIMSKSSEDFPFSRSPRSTGTAA
jgi:hypothetical protein